MAVRSQGSGPTACRLYLLTPPRIDDINAFVAQLDDALAGCDVACLQLRLKDTDATPAADDHIEAVARAVLPVAHAHDVAVLINDRPDLAAAVGADGAHIGQDDMSLAHARETLGPDAIIGVTCHASRHLAMVAGEQGADYVAFGAFFPTETKTPKAAADPEILTWWTELMEVPCVAIGGITVENCRSLVDAGADFLCVSSGVWRHPEGPRAAVAQFCTIFEDAARMAQA